MTGERWHEPAKAEAGRLLLEAADRRVGFVERTFGRDRVRPEVFGEVGDEVWRRHASLPRKKEATPDATPKGAANSFTRADDSLSRSRERRTNLRLRKSPVQRFLASDSYPVADNRMRRFLMVV